MGGYGSGGHNKTHDYAERYKRLDSFDYGECISLMKKNQVSVTENIEKWQDGTSIGVILQQDRAFIAYRFDEEKIIDKFHLCTIKSNYGGERVYFECRYCGRRCRYIYLRYQHFKCRECAKLSYRSQQNKNNFSIARKMLKMLYEKFKIGESLSLYAAVHYLPDRPKGMHEKTYAKLFRQFLNLQEAHFSFFEDLAPSLAMKQQQNAINYQRF